MELDPENAVKTKSDLFVLSSALEDCHQGTHVHLGGNVMVMVAIHLVFPGHVLFFRVKNSVRPDFFHLAKCPGF